MRRLSIVGSRFAAALILSMLPGAVMAQVDSREGIALQNQIYQLRQEIQTLRDQVARGGGGGGGGGGGSLFGGGSRPSAPSGGGDMVAQLLTRVDGLDDQMRQLRGRIDELQNQLQRQNADLTKRIEDLTYQLNSRPGGGGGGVQAPPPAPTGGGFLTPPPSAPSGPTATPFTAQPDQPRIRTAELAMQEGNAALARRDYAAAEAAAREVIAMRSSPRAYDGQFLLAQALLGSRAYSEAALAYDDAYKRNRKGGHAQDSLLGLANALVGVGEKPAACATLTKLHSEFPQPRGDLRDAIAAAAQRAGCH